MGFLYPCPMRELKTVDQVLIALGSGDKFAGRRELARITRKKPQHVWNWRHERRFPSCFWLVINHALAEHDACMRPSLCGMRPPLRVAA